MRAVPVSSVGSVAIELVDRARSALADRLTLADVLQWTREQKAPRTVVEIVTQDEYTHDVVVPFDGEHFLAFDAT